MPFDIPIFSACAGLAIPAQGTRDAWEAMAQGSRTSGQPHIRRDERLCSRSMCLLAPVARALLLLHLHAF